MTTCHIAVASMMRDSQVFHGREIRQVERFFRQLKNQQGRGTSFRLTFHLVEGDSRDDTHAAIVREMSAWEEREGGPIGELFKFDHGGPNVSSVESDIRFKALSRVANVAFRAARDSGADYVLWTESDLILGPELTTSLLDGFRLGKGVGAVAPLPIFLQNAQRAFYDVWAFCGLDGRKWGNHELTELIIGERYKPMAAVGCCALFGGNILRKVNADFGEGCFPFLCAKLRDAGATVWLDSVTEIMHPSSENVRGRLI